VFARRYLFGSPTLMGAFAFGFSGAVGSWLGSTLLGAWKLPKSARGLDVGMVLALAIGDAVLGTALGWAKKLTWPLTPRTLAPTIDRDQL
jgi:hypothetical protein